MKNKKTLFKEVLKLSLFISFIFFNSVISVTDFLLLSTTIHFVDSFLLAKKKNLTKSILPSVNTVLSFAILIFLFILKKNQNDCGIVITSLVFGLFLITSFYSKGSKLEKLFYNRKEKSYVVSMKASNLKNLILSLIKLDCFSYKFIVGDYIYGFKNKKLRKTIITKKQIKKIHENPCYEMKEINKSHLKSFSLLESLLDSEWSLKNNCHTVKKLLSNIDNEII